jgi:DNA-binding transcriptional LysR family regulator
MGAKTQDHREESTDARWDDVRVFLIALRRGSLGAAASMLGLDTSTVSRRLTALEEAIGGRLFDRGREGLTPTRLAELVLPAAEAMEAAHGRFARDASSFEGGAEGVVRISVPPGMADVFVAPALVRLRAKHPKIRIELDASVRVLDLTRHEADIALRSIRPVGADLVVTKLVTSSWVVATAPALAKKLGRIESWNDVPFIAWDSDLASMPFARWTAKHAPRAEVVLKTSHFLAQIVAAEQGLGLVLVPEEYTRVRSLKVVRHAPSLDASVADLPIDDLWLVGHRALRDVPRIDAVWNFILEDLGTRPKGHERVSS